MKFNQYNNNLYSSFKYFFKYGYIKEYRSWRWVINYYFFVSLLLVFGVLILIYSFHIFPPKTTVIAAGQVGSSTVKMAESYQKYFKEHDLTLDIVTGEGREEGFLKLDSSESPVNASFYIAGHINPDSYPNIVSLGSVQDAPLWFFYRGNVVKSGDPFTALKGKKIAIGLPGTATNSMFRRLLNGRTSSQTDGMQLIELSYRDAQTQLLAGQIDAIFMVYSMDTQIIQELIHHPEVHILNIGMAEAFTKQYPNLEKVTIPRGSFDIEMELPREDITLLATSVNLLVDKKLHPAIQWALLLSAKQYSHQVKDFFSLPGEYPKDLDYDSVPLSPVAERFYSGGVPQVFNALPIWLASMIDHLWIKVLALIIIVYPLLVKFLGFRSFASTKIKNDCFGYLRYLKIQGHKTDNPIELEKIIKQLNELIVMVPNLWGTDEDAKDFIELVLLTRQAKEEFEEKLKTHSITI